MIEPNSNLTFLIKEYEKLKDEQHKRIEFRDHMIYLTLAAIGTVFSFALEKPDLNIALLVLPFLCIVLGWSYLANDEKISSIGNYVRTSLVPKLKENNPHDKLLLCGHWEDFLKKDKSRRQRKLFQLFIDLSIYCFSGLISIISFYTLHDTVHWYFILISIAEGLLLIFLTCQFIKYADLTKYK
ncbi:MAG: hypothetical protein KGZ62_01655 [Sulfurimonas sp.]|nr:hypothetical protein [Sulfurimonas sp.]